MLLCCIKICVVAFPMYYTSGRRSPNSRNALFLPNLATTTHNTPCAALQHHTLPLEPFDLTNRTEILFMCDNCHHCVCGQETHRVKLLVGALEICLEQATILALLRIASSAVPPPATQSNATPTAIPPTATVLFEPAAAAASSGPEGSSAMSQPQPTPALAFAVEERGVEEVKAAPSDIAAAGGDADAALLEVETKSGAGAAMMPMMPSGVTVTLSVDVAAVGVVLTESGARVAAVTVSAANCKVNVSTWENLFCCRTSSIAAPKFNGLSTLEDVILSASALLTCGLQATGTTISVDVARY